jgi:hypothetical protein
MYAAHKLTARANRLVNQSSKDSQQLHDALIEVENLKMKIQTLQNRKKVLKRSHDAMRKKIERHRVQQNVQLAHTSQSPSNQFKLKYDNGVIRPEVRDMLRQLAGEGVATERILSVIRAVTGSLGITIIDSISARSVSRTVLEGLIQAKMQIAFEINESECKYYP